MNQNASYFWIHISNKSPFSFSTKHHLLLTAPSPQQLCGLPGPGAGQLGHALYQEGRCQWCGCGLRCANLWDFLHHLREEHQVTRVIRDT